MKTDDNIRELVYMLENVDLVRYAVLAYFCRFQLENKHKIEEFLKKKRIEIEK